MEIPIKITPGSVDIFSISKTTEGPDFLSFQIVFPAGFWSQTIYVNRIGPKRLGVRTADFGSAFTTIDFGIGNDHKYLFREVYSGVWIAIFKSSPVIEFIENPNYAQETV